MTISIIVAASENHVIGRDGGLPWHLPADLKHFKELTWGMPIIMGRRTFESIGKPLPGRTSIVITSDSAWKNEGVLRASNIQDAIQLAEATGCREAFIIGGGTIYQQMMEQSHRIYLTRVHASVDGDTFFPAPDPDQWELISSEDHAADEKNNYAYAFQQWNKKS